ncbi:MAG: type II secretion system F family protein [Phycisphaerales bacterium]
MKLIYEGYDKAGKAVRGVVDAKDTNDAKDSLRKQSIFAVKLRAAEAGGLAMMEDHDQRRIRGNTARLERVSFMMRQLSLLVATGTTVVEALASLHSQAGEGEWKKVVGAIRVKVEEGKTLAEAMGQHPQYFDAVAISLIAAGEAGGQLSVMSDRLSKLIRQQVRIRKTVSQAMIYPAVLMCVAAVVIVTMVTFVLPRFEGLFASLGTDLPAMTKVLMTINHFLRAQWYFVVGGLIATIGGGYAYFRSLKGQQTLDAAALRLPKLGQFTKAYSAARIARVMGTLLEAKVPMLEALALSKHIVKNSYYVALMHRAEEVVMRGDSISVAFNDRELLPASVIEAVRSGEKSGNLAPVLASVADFMDEDTEQTIKTVTGLMEPVILLVLGLVVGSMAISMLLPLFDLTAAGGGGAQ